MLKYFVIYKPFGVLSQFTKEVPTHRTLGDLYDFPPDVYPVGRLDKDSEGLLIISNDKRLNHRLLNPDFQHRRQYWVQVEGTPDAAALAQLEQGLEIRFNKKTYQTLPAEVALLPTPVNLPERDPPVRFRKSIPTTWIALWLKEGKNRQVRRMCAKIGYPTLRLVRVAIEQLEIPDFKIGEVKAIAGEILKKKLGIS
ncbi:MAG: pseudouridine synthase [Saprospiraceae bacterium]